MTEAHRSMQLDSTQPQTASGSSESPQNNLKVHKIIFTWKLSKNFLTKVIISSMHEEGTLKPRLLKGNAGGSDTCVTRVTESLPNSTQLKENNKFLIRDTGECMTCMYEREYSHSIQIMRTICCFKKRHKVLQLEGHPSFEYKIKALVLKRWMGT